MTSRVQRVCDRCGSAWWADEDAGRRIIRMSFGPEIAPRAPDLCETCWRSFLAWLARIPEQDFDAALPGHRAAIEALGGRMPLYEDPAEELVPNPAHWERPS